MPRGTRRAFARSVSPRWGSIRFSFGPPHVRPMVWALGMHGEPNESKKNTHPEHITVFPLGQVCGAVQPGVQGLPCRRVLRGNEQQAGPKRRHQVGVHVCPCVSVCVRVCVRVCPCVSVCVRVCLLCGCGCGCGCGCVSQCVSSRPKQCHQVSVRVCPLSLSLFFFLFLCARA